MNTESLRSRVASRLQVATGLQSYLEARATGAAIICYHGVVKQISDPDLECWVVDAATLSSHLRFFRRRYEVVPLSQIIAASRERQPIPNSWLALTLDDALECQVTLAAEVLADHNAPWSMAVPAGLIGSQRSVWSYELAFLLLNCWTEPSIPDPTGTAAGLPMRSAQDRQTALAHVRRVLFSPSPGNLILRYINSLVARFGQDRFIQRLNEYGCFKLASWDQLRCLQDQGVELLAHGWHHLPLDSGLSESEVNQEVREPRKIMQAMLGVAPKGFVYPHGRRVSDSADKVQDAGYEFGLTTVTGRTMGSSALYELPRYDGAHNLSALRRHLLNNPMAPEHRPTAQTSPNLAADEVSYPASTPRSC